MDVRSDKLNLAIALTLTAFACLIAGSQGIALFAGYGLMHLFYRRLK